LLDLINDDYVVALELSMFTFNTKREVCGVFNGFLSFFLKYEKDKTHNMLFLLLDPRFKKFKLISFIGREQVVSIMEEYDQQSSFLMFLKCYHIFQPMVEFEHVANMQTHEKNSLDIFEMSTRTNEPTKEVVNKEL
jgi:hypothetical protein